MICPNCHGAAWLIQPVTLNNDRNDVMNLPCPVCHGTGTVPDDTPAPAATNGEARDKPPGG